MLNKCSLPLPFYNVEAPGGSVITEEGAGGRLVWISRTPRGVFGWADQHQLERHLELQSSASAPWAAATSLLSAAEKQKYSPVLCPGREKRQVGADRTAGHEISRPVLASCSQRHRKREANGQRNLMRKQWSPVILRQRAVCNRWKRKKMRKIKDICPFQLWQSHEMNVSDHWE